jgi:hypothetical protein
MPNSSVPVGEEQRGGGEQMGGPDDLAGGGPDRRRLLVGQVGGRDRGDREDHEEDRRFDERPEGDGPARAHLGVGGTGVRAGQRGDETGQREQEAAAEDVALIAERQPVAREHRDEQRHGQVGDEGHQWRHQEHPAGALRDQRLLAVQLGEVVVGLGDPWPAAALQPRFEPGDDPGDSGREDQNRAALQRLYGRSRQTAHRPVRAGRGGASRRAQHRRNRPTAATRALHLSAARVRARIW